MAKNTTSQLTERGNAAVALTAAVLVALTGTGHGVEASLGAVILYLAVNGKKRTTRLSRNRLASQWLRGGCWAVVALALYLATQHHPAPGGATLGVSLAVALAVALRITRK